MFILYVDESGVEELNVPPPHFVLLGLMIPAAEWKTLDGAIEGVKGRVRVAGDGGSLRVSDCESGGDIELEGALARPGPALVRALPEDWGAIDDSARRRELFIRVLRPLVAAENERIRAERTEVKAFLTAEARGRAAPEGTEVQVDLKDGFVHVPDEEVENLHPIAELEDVVRNVELGAHDDIRVRLFVDGLLEIGNLTQDERAHIESQVAAEGRSLAEVLEEASETISGLSRCAGLVVAPKLGDPLKHIEFVSLGPGRALVVLISVSGVVENRIIDVPPGLPISRLARRLPKARMSGA